MKTPKYKHNVTLDSECADCIEIKTDNDQALANQIKWVLEYISYSEGYQIEGDDFEIIGEDENGRDGVYTESLIKIAGLAHTRIKELEQKLNEQIACSAKGVKNDYR